MKKAFKLALVGILPLIGFAAYVSYSVGYAYTTTPKILSEILKKSDPQITRVPREWLDLIIAKEDPAFWKSETLKLEDFSKAQQGVAASISKQIYFDNFTPLLHQAELVLSKELVLEQQTSKLDQLRIFLSIAYLGEGPNGPIEGFPAGAKHYFQKPLLQLSDGEFAQLVTVFNREQERRQKSEWGLFGKLIG